MQMLQAIYRYRAFIAGSIAREFQSKYRNSLLGALWNILNPLAMITVYTVIFSQIMRAKLPGIDTAFAYSIYLCAGILTWGLFSEITNRCLQIFVDNANLLKKLNFPRLCLPMIVVGSALLNFGIVFSLFTLFLILTGNFPGWSFLGLFPVLAIQALFATSLGLSLGILNVFFRDIGQFFGIFTQFWFWLTPIVYPISIIPENIRWLINLNPMTQIMTAYQNILVSNIWPDWYSLLPITLVSGLLCIWCIRLFRKRSSEIVDEL
jgi:lipopolysaccharide transport system permease protein